MDIDIASFNTPGQLITHLLEARNWTQRTLAIIMGVDETGLNKVVAGKRSIDASTALILEEIFGVDASCFLKLQKSYDLKVARIEARPNPKRKTRAQIYGDLPVSAMISRGWIDAKDIRDLESVEGSLCRFFGVNQIEDIEILPHAAKKTEVSIPATPAQIAWLYRVKMLAKEMIVGKYSPAAVENAIEKIRPLLGSPEELRKVPRIMAEAGIRFVIVEALPSSKIDGVCFWLNNASPVIGMTIRYDRIDNFCFVLRHELEHVVNRDGLNTMMLDVDLHSQETQHQVTEIEHQEQLANEAAAEFCVPQKLMNAFIARKAPIYAERDIIGLSRMANVHPGLIAGQLQRRTGLYNRFRNHLVPIRRIITPNAVTDGWGDVAPVDNV
jgi:HTH-type transcriptional regulator/antitoxin HigA